MKNTTMNNKAGYEINHDKKAIILTQKFNKAAGVYGSDEYKIFVGLVKDWNNYKIEVREIEKKTDKVSYKGLTIYKMQAVVEIVADEESIALFQKQLKVYEGEKGKYATIKKLFLNSYRETYNNLSDEEMVDVDRLAKEIKAKALKEKEEAEKAANAEKIKAEVAAREVRRAKKAKALEAVAEDTKEATTPEATNVRKMTA